MQKLHILIAVIRLGCSTEWLFWGNIIFTKSIEHKRISNHSLWKSFNIWFWWQILTSLNRGASSPNSLKNKLAWAPCSLFFSGFSYLILSCGGENRKNLDSYFPIKAESRWFFAMCVAEHYGTFHLSSWSWKGSFYKPRSKVEQMHVAWYFYALKKHPFCSSALVATVDLSIP